MCFVTESSGGKGNARTSIDVGSALVQLVGPLRRGVQRAARTAPVSPDDREAAGATEPQIEVLRLLATGGPWSTSTLAARLDLAPSTLSNLLRELERDGRVVRSRVRDDQRRVDVTVQQPGLEALDRHARRAAQAVQGHVQALPQVDQEALALAMPALARLVDSLSSDR